MLQRVRSGEQIERTINLPGDAKNSRRSERHAAHGFRGVDTGEIHGGALAGVRALDGRAVNLQSANTRALAAGIELDLIVKREGAGNQRARDHGSVAAHGKAAIDGQARESRRVFPGDRGGRVFERSSAAHRDPRRYWR